MSLAKFGLTFTSVFDILKKYLYLLFYRSLNTAFCVKFQIEIKIQFRIPKSHLETSSCMWQDNSRRIYVFRVYFNNYLVQIEAISGVPTRTNEELWKIASLYATSLRFYGSVPTFLFSSIFFL